MIQGSKSRYAFAKGFFLDRIAPIGLEFTNQCSGRCTFCWYRHNTDGRSKGAMGKETLNRAIKLIDEYNKEPTIISILTSHGDITMCNKFGAYLALLASQRFCKGISFFTNAILLNRFDLGKLMKLPLHQVHFSFTVFEEQFKRLRGVDAYHQTLANILEFARLNKQRWNRAVLSMLLANDKPFDYQDADYRKLLSALGKKNIAIIEEWDDFNGLITVNDIPRGHGFKPNIQDKKVPCYGLFRKMKILKDGEVAVCAVRVNPAFIIGNIFDYYSLRILWNGEAHRELIADWERGKLPEICKTCTHYHPVTKSYDSYNRQGTFFNRVMADLKLRIKRRHYGR